MAAVPLQSSTDKDKFTDHVVIMPVSTRELASLMERSADYDEIIASVHALFEEDRRDFDLEWRDKFMGKIFF